MNLKNLIINNIWYKILYNGTIERLIDSHLKPTDIHIFTDMIDSNKINATSIKNINIINYVKSGNYFHVKKVDYEGKFFAFKELKKERDRYQNQFILINSAIALKVGHELFPERFPKLETIVALEDKSRYKDFTFLDGMLVEFLDASEYISLKDYHGKLSLETLDEMEHIIEEMHKNDICLDVKPENIFLKKNHEKISDFIFIDPMYYPGKISFYRTDWEFMKAIKKQFYDGDYSFEKLTEEFIKQTVSSYLSALKN